MGLVVPPLRPVTCPHVRVCAFATGIMNAVAASDSASTPRTALFTSVSVSARAAERLSRRGRSVTARPLEEASAFRAKR
jgi:hypothetical protein